MAMLNTDPKQPTSLRQSWRSMGLRRSLHGHSQLFDSKSAVPFAAEPDLAFTALRHRYLELWHQRLRPRREREGYRRCSGERSRGPCRQSVQVSQKVRSSFSS